MSGEEAKKDGDPGPDPADKKFFSKGGIAQFRPKTGGLLNVGGTPGHKTDNSGATPKAIREALREQFKKNIKMLETIAKSTKSTNSEKLKAMEMMVKYGAGTPSALLDNEGNAMQGLVVREVEESASTTQELDEETGAGDVPA